MIAIDTNILVHAHRQEMPKHSLALETVQDLAQGYEEIWAIPVFCLGEFLRLVTHPKVFSPPHSYNAAIGSLKSLLDSPSGRVLYPTGSFDECFYNLVETYGITGNKIFDAQIAAVCLEHGFDRILTEDQDFHKFVELTVVSL